MALKQLFILVIAQYGFKPIYEEELSDIFIVDNSCLLLLDYLFTAYLCATCVCNRYYIYNSTIFLPGKTADFCASYI